jgi:hypothetical protein
MSTVDTTPQHTALSGGRGSHLGPARTVLRLALLEARRSPMPLMLPMVAALFWFDALRTGQNLPPLWTQRAAILPDHVLPDLGPVSAGMAAWIGGREARRGMADLAESTARPRWLRQLAGWAGALAWTMFVYAACAAVVYVLAARVTRWGGPPWWPVAVTGFAVALFCTIGFVAGAVFPGRFTPPLAAIGTLFVSVMVFQSAVSARSGWVLLSPNNVVPPLDWGVFHSVPPDLPIVQILFLLGAVTVLLGALGVLGAMPRAQLRLTSFAVTGLGATACVAALALATTASLGAYGYTVPALHGAASDQPIPYTPVCTQGVSAPVCIHPAFSGDLSEVSADFAPVLARVAGLPGAATRAMQIDMQDLPGAQTGAPLNALSEYGAGVTLAAGAGGPILEYGFDDPDAFAEPDTAAYLRAQAALLVIGRLIAPDGEPGAAQQAVEAALYQAAGVPLINTASGDSNASSSSSSDAGSGRAHQRGESSGTDPQTGVPGPVPGSAVAAAAGRFAALSAADRHAWLVAHLGQLRSGLVTLQELP